MGYVRDKTAIPWVICHGTTKQAEPGRTFGKISILQVTSIPVWVFTLPVIGVAYHVMQIQSGLPV